MTVDRKEINDPGSPAEGQGTFVLLQTFTNYIEAHMVMGNLEEEGIRCWLKDENTVTLIPIWTGAVGGIKLMVAASQAEKAAGLLRQLKLDKRKNIRCIHCGSSNVEFVSTPRKAVNWLSALATFFLGDFAIAPDKVYHCFDCRQEYAATEDTD